MVRLLVIGLERRSAEMVRVAVPAWIPILATTAITACGSTAPPSKVSAGSDHSCAIDEEGKAFCWGSGSRGALGIGREAKQVARPEAIVGDHRWSSISAGTGYGCGITTDGVALCWGSGNLGKRGDGTLEATLEPTPVAGDHRWKGISAGLTHTCGVATDGQGWCWGDGSSGELGNGMLDTNRTPVLVSGDHRWQKISVSSSHACGLTTKGDAYCWGYGTNGALGIGGSRADKKPFESVGENRYEGRRSPTLVVGNHQWRDLTAGSYFSCGVTMDGQAYCWGTNGDTYPAVERGNLGVSGVDEVFAPIPVSGTQRFSAISAGESHACAVTEKGEAYCWGKGQYGRLGNGETSDRAIPSLVDGEHVWLAVEAGDAHTCGMTRTAQVFCWGAVGLGRLGSLGGHARSPRAVLGELGASPDARSKSAERSKASGKASVWAEGSFEEAEMIGDQLGARYRGAGTLVERRYLRVREDLITLVISQRVRGFGGEVECRGRPDEGLRSPMTVTLDCDQDKPVRLEMEFDDTQRAWNVRMDDDPESNPYRRR